MSSLSSNEDPNPLLNSQSVNRSIIDDLSQLEYDEHGISLIADQEFDDDDGDEITNDVVGNRKTITSNINSDGIIDDDFETELGINEITEFDESDNPDYHLLKKISEYRIIELCDDDKFGRKVFVCSACRLPHETAIRNSEFQSVEIFYEYLLKYVLKTFDQYAEMDYVIIYFHHGLHSYNRPSYRWLMRAYMDLDRKYKKNLKAFFIVHPTTWIKFLWPFLRSIISAKFSSKLIYIDHLDELSSYVYLNDILIPDEVKTIDSIHPISIEIKSTMKFNVSLKFILDNEQNETIPIVIRQTSDFIKNNGLNLPMIFRRTTPVRLINEVKDRYNQGQTIHFEEYGDVHLACSILKIFFRSLTEPLLTFRLYCEILGLSALKRYHQLDVIRDLIIEKLPNENYYVLKYLIEFLNLISSYSDLNFMTTKHLSIVFGSNLIWSDDVNMNTLQSISLINAFVETLITHYTELFLK